MLFEWILAAWVDDYSGDEGRRLAGEGDQTLALAAGLECTGGVHPRRSFIEDLGRGGCASSGAKVGPTSWPGLDRLTD